ncbi:MAG: putative ABC transporter permease [Lachnospiraceae bacterium]
MATAVEWFTGKVLERMKHRKWWDYSGKKWNFDGYICLSYSLLWGILGTFCLYYGNEYFTILYKLLPGLLARSWCGLSSEEALMRWYPTRRCFITRRKCREKVQDFDRELRRWTKRLGRVGLRSCGDPN